MEKFKDNFIVANVISSYMTGTDQGLFVTHTVGELLWGYEDGLLKALKTFQPDLDDVFGLFYKVSFKHMNTLLNAFHRHECGYSWKGAIDIRVVCRNITRIAKETRNQEFLRDGWWIYLFFFLPQTNASNDGEYVFFSGQENYKDFARVDTWNSQR